jgi:hypothetical protein
MTQLVVLWAALGVVTLALALYRKFVSMHEDPYVHVSEGEQRMIPEQVRTFRRLGVIDRWGVTLTIITAVFGLILAGVYLYQIAPR